MASRPVDKVIYQVIPEKASQIAALLAGQVDLVAGVPVPERAPRRGCRGIKTMKQSSNRLHMLYLRSEIESGNMAKKYPDYKPATLDKRIRQAISHALDRNLLAEVQGQCDSNPCTVEPQRSGELRREVRRRRGGRRMVRSGVGQEADQGSRV